MKSGYTIRDAVSGKYIHKESMLAFPRLTDDVGLAIRFVSDVAAIVATTNLPMQVIGEVEPMEDDGDE